MKRRILGLVAAALAPVPVLAGPPLPSAREVGGNLAANPGFETVAAGTFAASWPASWRGDAGLYRRDARVRRSGRASLAWTNDDESAFRVCSQEIELVPGGRYRVRGFVKTDGVRTREPERDKPGARIALQWYDGDGRWLGGIYPLGVSGTRDWTSVEESGRVPENAASFRLSCFAARGSTGRAWFDDLEVVRELEDPLATTLLVPNYRGWIPAESDAPIRIRTRIHPHDLPRPAGDLELRARLRTGSGAILREVAPPLPPSGDLDVEIPAAGLAPGAYEAVVELRESDGAVLAVATHGVRKLSPDFLPRIFIDEHGRVLRNGEPFFPLGMYWSGLEEPDLETYARSRFNCVMPYRSPTRAEMDLAHRLGLMVVYSLKDLYAGTQWCPGFIRSVDDEEPAVRERVREFRDHPALLAWYTNDELPLEYLPRLVAHREWIMEEDPHHPTWTVLWQLDQVRRYLDSFDIIGTHPFPVGRERVSEAAKMTAETRRQVFGARPLWQVPQAHNWANYGDTERDRRHGRTPTFEEMRSLAWQCLCEGATGLFFYSWFDIQRNPDVPFDEQWARLERIAAEVDRWTGVLLSVEEPPAVEAEGSPSWIRWCTRRIGDRVWLFVVNDGDGEGDVTFRAPADLAAATDADGDRPLSVSNGRFRDSLDPLDVRVYELSF